ncbi:MAG: helix-turn-helix transcriptional regulator [Desulfovibrio sp.]|nr:helix-turn-helix transcriptional regulator [Desulfovibrio sp.]
MDGREVEESLERFGSNLKTARLRRGLSQAGVAAMAGVSQRTLQKLEGGDPGVKIQTAASVMKVLGFGTPFDSLCSPGTDEEGRLLDMERVPKRGRRHLLKDEGESGRNALAEEEPAGPSM